MYWMKEVSFFVRRCTLCFVLVNLGYCLLQNNPDMKQSAEKAILPGMLAISITTMLERLAFFLTISVTVTYFQEERTMSLTEAGQLYSMFYALLMFTPLFFGVIADFTNRRAVIASGLITLMIGYLLISLLQVDYKYMVFLPLIAIALGTGAFRPNIPVVLGKLFDHNHLHHRGYIGFIIFYAFINIGALPAPFIAQYLKNNMGYEAVFLGSALFVLMAYIVFLVTRKYQIHVHLNTHTSHGKYEHRLKDSAFNVVVLICLLLFIIPINTALSQHGITLAFFIRDYFGDYSQIGVGIQGIRPLVVLFFSFFLAIGCYLLLKYSRFLLLKLISVGLVIAALGYGVLILSLQLYETSQPVNALYVAVVLISMGEALIAPAVIYTIYRTSPRNLKGLFMAVLGFLGAIGSQLLIVYAVVYEKQGALATFIIISSVLAGFGIFFFILQLILKNSQRSV